MFLLKQLICVCFIMGTVGISNNIGCVSLRTKQAEKVNKSMKQSLPSNVVKLKSSITNFLNAWLLEKDFTRALNYFSERSSVNKMMLEAECAGYIKDYQRNDSQAIRSGIEKFLRDFAAEQNGKKLSDILQIDRFNQENMPMILNNVKEDRYQLLRLKPNQLDKVLSNPQVGSTIRSDIKSEYFYISRISLNDGILYFLWTEESGTWKIYYADMVCV